MEKINFAQLRKYLRDHSHHELVDEILELIQRFDSVKYHYYSKLFAEEERRGLTQGNVVVEVRITREPEQQVRGISEDATPRPEAREKVDDARTALIQEMRGKGMAYKDIAQAVNLSHSRVRQISLAPGLERERQAQLRLLKMKIEQANNLDEEWPYQKLFTMMDFPSRAMTVLGNHFDERRIRILSLRGLLDFLLPLEYPRKDYVPGNIPAFNVHNFGYVTFISLVRHLSQLDLGEMFRQELMRRRAILLQLLKQSDDYAYLVRGLERLEPKA